MSQLQEQLETQFEEKSELMSKLKATEKQLADLQVLIFSSTIILFGVANSKVFLVSFVVNVTTV